MGPHDTDYHLDPSGSYPRREGTRVRGNSKSTVPYLRPLRSRMTHERTLLRRIRKIREVYDHAPSNERPGFSPRSTRENPKGFSPPPSRDKPETSYPNEGQIFQQQQIWQPTQHQKCYQKLPNTKNNCSPLRVLMLRSLGKEKEEEAADGGIDGEENEDDGTAQSCTASRDAPAPSSTTDRPFLSALNATTTTGDNREFKSPPPSITDLKQNVASLKAEYNENIDLYTPSSQGRIAPDQEHIRGPDPNRNVLNLRIVYCNFRGIIGKTRQLLDLVQLEDIHVILLGETKMRPQQELRLPNFVTYRRNEISVEAWPIRARTCWSGEISCMRRRSLPAMCPCAQ
ncbi:hypothetical protein EVAR_39822_1 [Eumeta japonica]|uniref:Endonuclease/exonuclease/phosphatase domain-containing protein n=1 Tax=Eumeta variegata TaxID=151549 RepID=A0A4C1XBZ2_EUMVA|nr:hypothetical protein EVAR_39822_1 [Eumeta japonica]